MAASADPASAPDPPRSPGHPILGNIPDVLEDLLGSLLKGWRARGDVVYFKVPRPMLLVGHPDGVQHVMNDAFETHPRSSVVRDRMADIVGQSIFSTMGEEWRARARIIRPAFQPDHVSKYAGIVTTTTTEMLDRWEKEIGPGEAFDLQPELVRLGLDIAGRVSFGDAWDPEAEAVRAAYVEALEYVIPRVTGFPTPIDPLLPPAWRYRAARDRLYEYIDRMVAARRAEPADDLLSTLVQARDPDSGEGLSDREIRDEVATAMFGVYKSVPIGTLWAWYALSQQPEAERRMRSELAGALDGGVPTLDDIPKLTYMNMVIDEVLRLYPPMFLFSRPPDNDEVIGGFKIPAGLLVLVCPYVTHRHPDVWENPEGFEPERFSPERAAGRHPYAYFPFGTGPRNCAAPEFGLMMLRLVLATMAQRVRIDLVPGHRITRNPEFLLRPANGLPVTLAPAAPPA